MNSFPRNFDEYKPIRNFIRKYNKHELLFTILQKSLYASRLKPSEWSKGYLPWEVLLLGRWLLLDWNNIKGTKRVSLNDFHKVINKIKIFSNRSEPFLGKDGVQNGLTKFARRTAFQQFWYQRDIHRGAIARAIKLFILPNYSEKVDEALIKEYGLARGEMLDLFFMVWASFIDDKFSSLKPEYFQKVYDTLGKKKADKFFQNFSLSIDDINDFNKQNPVKNFISEIHEKSPLYKKPFFKLRNFHLWSKPFLMEFLEFGIYDILKSITAEKFGDDFGPIFEKYIESRFLDHNISFKSESDLKKEGYESQVDFLIEGEEHLILIESKGIEATRRTQIFPSDELMSSDYKKNIVKGLSQAHYVNKKYSEINGKDKKTYALVITYKELFLGNGEVAWQEFIDSTLREKFDIYDFNIKSENIFFLSIDSFDKFLLCSNFQKEIMFEILDKIKETKKVVENKRFVFSHYLEDLKDYNLFEKEDENLNATFEGYYREMMRKYFNQDLNK